MGFDTIVLSEKKTHYPVLVDGDSLTKALTKIENVLLKPIVDLRSLPGLELALGRYDCGNFKYIHTRLGSLNNEIIRLINLINNNIIIVRDDSQGKVLALLLRLKPKLESMETQYNTLLQVPTTEDTKVKALELLPIDNLDVAMLPPEVWCLIFLRLSYQDKLNFSNVCVQFRKIAIKNNTLSTYTLAMRGFYSQNTYTMSSVVNALREAESKAKILFFRRENIFRGIFRKVLTDDTSVVKESVTTSQNSSK